MFGDKIENGIETLSKGITLIQEGIKERQAKVAKTEQEIADLQTKKDEMVEGITKGETIVANFKKNILGE